MKDTFHIVIVVLVIIAVGIGFFLGGWYIFRIRGNMPFSFMPGHQQGIASSINYINAAELKALKKGDNRVEIDEKSNRIVFKENNITIPVIGAEHDENMENKNNMGLFFEVFGLKNPDIIVPINARITLMFINEDEDMVHGVLITEDSPPFSTMGMMMNTSLAFNNGFVRPLPEARENRYPELSNSFLAGKSGSYYYICQVPEHANSGMYGRFIVKDNL